MEKSKAIEKIIKTIGCECTATINFCMTCKKDFKIGDSIICHCLEHEHEACYEKRNSVDAAPCGDCGHRRDWHFESRRNGYGCNMPNCDCDCKIFVKEKKGDGGEHGK